MSAYINITPTASRQSADVRATLDQLQNVCNDFAQIKSMFDQIALGGDFTSLAGYLGTTNAEAEAVYNLWGSALAELQGSFISQLLSRCG